jgi:hypothetical protein
MRKNERRGRKVCADSKLGRALETRLGSGQLGSFVQLWEVEEEKAIVHPGARQLNYQSWTRKQPTGRSGMDNRVKEEDAHPRLRWSPNVPSLGGCGPDRCVPTLDKHSAMDNHTTDTRRKDTWTASCKSSLRPLTVPNYPNVSQHNDKPPPPSKGWILRRHIGHETHHPRDVSSKEKRSGTLGRGRNDIAGARRDGTGRGCSGIAVVLRNHRDTYEDELARILRR